MPLRGRGLRRSGALGWIAVACLAGLAGCQSGGSPISGASNTELTFISAAQTWDLNKDNVVTCDEWKQYLTTSFGEVDANRDGVLSPDEFEKLAKQDRLFVTANYRYFAPKVEGKLTLAEMTEKPNPAFKRLDRDNDCRLVSEEMVRQYTASNKPEVEFHEKQGNTKPR